MSRKSLSFFLSMTAATILILLTTAFSVAGDEDGKLNVAQSLITKLDRIEASLERENLSEESLDSLRTELIAIEEEAISGKNDMQPQLEEAKARLEALKPAETKEGENASAETEALTSRRDELEQQIAELDGQYKLITSSLVRAGQLNNKITFIRQDRFTKRLFEQNGTILNPSLWVSGIAGIASSFDVAGKLFSDWGAFLASRAADKIWLIIGMIVVVALLIAGPLRWFLFSVLSRLTKIEDPTPMQRSLFACMTIIAYTTIPISTLLGAKLILSNAGLMPTRIEQFSNHLSYVLFAISLAYGLIRVLLAPRRPNYRLLNLRDGDAIRLYGIGLSLLAIFALETFFDETRQLFFTPLDATMLISGLSAILVAMSIWVGMRTIIAAEPAQKSEHHLMRGFSLPGFIQITRPLIWLACLTIIATPILGFISLGSFLAVQLGRIFIILALVGILSALIDNFLTEYLEKSDHRTQNYSRTVGIGTRTINQLGVLANGLVRILLYIGAALAIFAPWGVESTDFTTSLRNAIFNIQIGDLSISPINILGALLVLIVTLVLVRSLQRWMEKRLLPATDLDPGLKNSIQTSVGYVGFILAVMLAFSYMGVNLSNIALVAGALSVGIGFGLQSIVNNFVSGLILLVERPIKTGDWVVVGNDQGYVRKISVRATKIETFDRATVIVPNSDLISNRVMNWMHNGSMGRVIIPIGVSYDADPEKVRDILLKVANESEYVASYPGPSVFFMDFGASSLDFELRCYIQDINSSLSAKSALRFAIFREMKGAQIEIPFPQQDIHVRSVTMPEENLSMPDKQGQNDSARKADSSRLNADEIDLDSDSTSEIGTASGGQENNGEH